MTDTRRLQEEFWRCYAQPTSGSAGAGILKLINEEMPEASGSSAFKELERAATALQGLEDRDPHPLLYGQIAGAWDALIGEWEAVYGPGNQNSRQ